MDDNLNNIAEEILRDLVTPDMTAEIAIKLLHGDSMTAIERMTAFTLLSLGAVQISLDNPTQALSEKVDRAIDSTTLEIQLEK